MYDLISAELFNTPHLVSANRLDAMASVLLSRRGMDLQIQEQPELSSFSPQAGMEHSDSGYFIDSGVAIIDMMGTMVHRGGSMQALSGMMSYKLLSNQFNSALSDQKVSAVLVIGNTPGGSVNGAFDFADDVFLARGVKPVYFIAEDHLLSAGYLIASGAQEVHVTQTGDVGSIGVVMRHLDLSAQNTQDGVSSTFIFAGDRKIDGNTDMPLSNEVFSIFQDEINKIYGMFVSTVERGGMISRGDIISTQAQTYMGVDAVSVGLAASVTTSNELLELIKTRHGKSAAVLTTINQRQRTNQMSAEKKEPVITNDPVVPQATSVVAEDASMTEQEIRNDERERFATIMNNDAVKCGLHTSAVHLATKSDMSATDIIAMLGDMPKVSAEKSKLDAAMASTDQPGIQSDAEGETEVSGASKILSSFNAAIGKRT